MMRAAEQKTSSSWTVEVHAASYSDKTHGFHFHFVLAAFLIRDVINK